MTPNSTKANTEIMHTMMCEVCMDIKPTGLSMKLYKKWKAHHGRREVIERSVAQLTSSHDMDLLKDKVCFECRYVDEWVELKNDDVRFLK